MTSKTDFFPESDFPNGVSFDLPDHLVLLHEYKQALFMEQLVRARMTGEMVPLRLLTERLATELDITEEQVLEFAVIGNWINYDREIRAMSDSEREAHYAEMSRPITQEEIDGVRELGLPTLDEIIDKIKQDQAMRDLETQALNDLLKDI